MSSVKRNILLVVVTVGMLYSVLQLARPVEIVAVHTMEFGQDNFSHDILVRHFPITERGKITWWQNHQSMLKKEYGIPKTDTDGSFSITVWDFGDGYQIEKPKASFFPNRDTSYLLCFDDMPAKENCIEKKNQYMSIHKNGTSNIIFFSVRRFLSERSTRYIQTTEGGEIIKGANN